MDQQQPSNAHRRRRHNLKTVRCPNLVDGGLSNMADHSFDIIRCQFLNLSITSQEYKELLQEVWRVCAPGGFIELVELDMRIYYDQPGGATLAKITQQFNSEGTLFAGLCRKRIMANYTRCTIFSDSCDGS